MRAVAAFVLVAALAVGCGRERAAPGSPGGSPGAETGSPAATPLEELPGATCTNLNRGNPANFPDFVGVEVDSSAGADRITFRFKPKPEAPDAPPSYFVYFTEELVTEGEGRPVDVEGQAFVIVAFQAIGTDLSGETPVAVYMGKERFRPGFPTLREAVMLGDFEGQVSWGLGLSEKACYRVDAAADHLTVEFPSA
jgi:hypothetical protein